MRNVIAALVAVAAVATVVWFGWTELAVRTEPDESGPSAQEVLAEFVTAFNAGDAETMATLVHPDDQVGLDGLLDATTAMRNDLDLAALQLSLGEVDVADERAQATTTLAVTLANLPGADADAGGAETGDEGTIGWLASLAAIERRSGWFVRPDRSALHPSLTGNTGFLRRQVATPRASILAVDGTPLTLHGDLETLGIAPGQIRDADVLRARWAEVLPQSQPQLAAVLDRDDLQPEWFYPVVSLPREEVEAAWSRLRTLPGVIRRSADEVGSTATSTIAGHVLGQVGPADDELAASLGVEPGTSVGISGLEQVYEDQLVGSDTVEVVIATGEGATVEVLGEAQVDPSMPVSTSLDASLQESVESALLGIEDLVAVVAVRTDGGIAASASRPLSGYNRAWEGNYPPGDLFYPVSTSALIQSGTNLDTPVQCPPEVVLSGATVTTPRNALTASSSDQPVAFREALAAGCDTSMALLAQDLAPESLAEMAADWGWGEEPSLPLPAATPDFPLPGDTTETIRAALGQARVQASPLHLASVGAAMLSGQRIAPWLVVNTAGDARRIPVDTGGLVEVAQASAVDGSGASVSARDIGVVVGTAPVTGDDVVHSWAMLLVDDLGIVVLAEDTGGDLELVRRISRRIEGELVGRGSTSTPSDPPTATTTPGPAATPAPAADTPADAGADTGADDRAPDDHAGTHPEPRSHLVTLVFAQAADGATGFSWWILVPTLVMLSVAAAAAPWWPWSREWGWSLAGIFAVAAGTAALFTVGWWFS